MRLASSRLLLALAAGSCAGPTRAITTRYSVSTLPDADPAPRDCALGCEARWGGFDESGRGPGASQEPAANARGFEQCLRACSGIEVSEGICVAGQEPPGTLCWSVAGEIPRDPPPASDSGSDSGEFCGELLGHLIGALLSAPSSSSGSSGSTARSSGSRAPAAPSRRHEPASPSRSPDHTPASPSRR